MIGPDGAAHAWDALIPRLLDRALDVRRAGLGLALTCAAVLWSVTVLALRVSPMCPASDQWAVECDAS
eukprot:8112322-Pyramimonas_sp.AAC.1